MDGPAAARGLSTQKVRPAAGCLGLPRWARRSRRRQRRRTRCAFAFPRGAVSRPDGAFIPHMTQLSSGPSRPRVLRLTQETELRNGREHRPAGERRFTDRRSGASFEARGVADGVPGWKAVAAAPGGDQWPGGTILVLVEGWPPNRRLWRQRVGDFRCQELGPDLGGFGLRLGGPLLAPGTTGRPFDFRRAANPGRGLCQWGFRSSTSPFFWRLGGASP